MPPRRRHPKKDIEAALQTAEAAGWVVEEIHRGHRWGLARCPAGEHAVAVWSTPRDPATLGKLIREQVSKCQHRPDGKEGP